MSRLVIGGIWRYAAHIRDFSLLKADLAKSYSYPNPEPATIGLPALGGCLGLLRRRRG